MWHTGISGDATAMDNADIYEARRAVSMVQQALPDAVPGQYIVHLRQDAELVNAPVDVSSR